MARAGMIGLAERWCPPALLGRLAAARRRWRPFPGRRITSLEELDREIARADEAATRSNEELLAVLRGFHFDPHVLCPRDPASPEYRRAQMEVYARLSGRDLYSPTACEMTEFDLPWAVQCPYPYSTRCAATLGHQLLGIGGMVRALATRPGDRVLEFGPGWGKTTLELAQLGLQVTAVDVNPKFLALVRERCAMVGASVETVCADMLAFEPAGRYDRVVFFESFHHCMDHEKLVERLDSMVAPGGAVVFAGEPIGPEYPLPWMVRLDGQSVWSIRKFGWLELGFQAGYFERMLTRHGWTMTRQCCAGWPDVLVARRAGGK